MKVREGAEDGGGRLDVALVSRGLVRSRTAAALAVAEGRVRLDGVVARRPSVVVPAGARLEVDPGDGWVGRAAGKLAAALDGFGIDPRGRLALDLGASTGGFTQVLLDRGARRVVALDVGHGQLVPELRRDPRVVVVERENARDLTAPRLASLSGTDAAPDVVVADLSFISLTMVLPAVARVSALEADIVCLIKPQFEVGRGGLKRGVVTDPDARSRAVRSVLDAAAEQGLRTAGLLASPVVGAHGNREVLLHLHRTRGSGPAEWSRSIGGIVGPDGEAR